MMLPTYFRKTALGVEETPPGACVGLLTTIPSYTPSAAQAFATADRFTP